MYIEARKMHLIGELLKVTSEDTLMKLEALLKKAPVKKEKKIPSAHDFVGRWTKKDTELIVKAIEESCEQINEDDWK